MLAMILIGVGTTVFYNEKSKYHRADGGPAIELEFGHKEWWINGKRHRLDGPAVDNKNSDSYKEWWINGIQYSEKDFNKRVGELC